MITRGDFLKIAAIGGTSLAAMGLVGCSSSSSTSSSTESASSESSSTESTSSESSSSEETTTSASTNPISDLVDYQTIANEMEEFVIHHSQQAKDLQVLVNMVSALVASDCNGNLVSSIAETWEANDDATVWTFHLRDDVTWVDVNGDEMASLTAWDFVAGLEWVLNAAKNGAANVSMPEEMLEGAEEYYNLTAEMDATEAAALAWNNDTFLDTVGISVEDDYTLVYTMKASKPYFDTVCTYACFFPIAPDLVSSMTAEEYLAIDNTTMWYCGPYIMTEYIQGNEKVLDANPSWFGLDTNTTFNSVTIKMVDSTDVAWTLYQSGEIDRCVLSESILATITEGTEYYDYLCEQRPSKYSYQFYFNYHRHDDDGNPDDNWNYAAGNEAFRLSWYYGLDLIDYYKRTNAVNPLKCENNFFTMKGLVSTSDGTDYTDLVAEGLDLKDYDGENMRRLNPELAEQYKEEAIEELTAQGVTFPVEVNYFISASSQTALDTANVLSDCLTASLGDDYVTLNIGTYVSSMNQEVRNLKRGGLYISGWGADYGDPINFLSQYVTESDNAYYSKYYTLINDFYGDDAAEPYNQELIDTFSEFTEMVWEGDAISDDLDARYKAFAEAEIYMIKHGLTIPAYYSISWQLTKSNDYSKANSLYGIFSDYYYVNWETNADGYTTADYAEFEAAAN